METYRVKYTAWIEVKANSHKEAADIVDGQSISNSFASEMILQEVCHEDQTDGCGLSADLLDDQDRCAYCGEVLVDGSCCPMVESS